MSFADPGSGKAPAFPANNFAPAASTIAKPYKARRRVELFFKWVKRYLRIKAFLGNGPDAVKTRVWTAVSAYVPVAIAERELSPEPPTGEIPQVWSPMPFEETPISQKTPISRVFPSGGGKIGDTQSHNPLSLFDF